MYIQPVTWFPVPSGDPHWLLGGAFLPTATRSWTSFGLHPGFNTYWFFGYHHRSGDWQPDAAVAHVTDVYSNGILTTVYYDDDDASDGDLNDFVVQVFAATGGIKGFMAPPGQAEINGKFETAVLPRLRGAD